MAQIHSACELLYVTLLPKSLNPAREFFVSPATSRSETYVLLFQCHWRLPKVLSSFFGLAIFCDRVLIAETLHSAEFLGMILSLFKVAFLTLFRPDNHFGLICK